MSRSPHAVSGWAWPLLGFTVVVGLLAGCSEPRMSLQNWEQVWDQTVEHVQRADAQEIPEQECTEILAYLRQQRPRLNPLPVEGLESPVDSWFELAESAFFDCPPDGEPISSWADGFEQLSRLEAEVDTVLARHR